MLSSARASSFLKNSDFCKQTNLPTWWTNKALSSNPPSATNPWHLPFSLLVSALSIVGQLEFSHNWGSSASARSTLRIKNPHYGSDERPSLSQWLVTILQRNPKASSDSGISDRGLTQLRPLLNLGSSSHQAADSRDDTAIAARLRPSSKIRRVARTAKTLRTTNDLGHKNLAELYARFDNIRVEGWRQNLLEIDAREGLTHNHSVPSNTQACEFENINKRQCCFCGLYFATEQNVRVLDTGSSPCSHHPGEKYFRYFN